MVEDSLSLSEVMMALNAVTVVKIGPRTNITSIIGIANWAGVILFSDFSHKNVAALGIRTRVDHRRTL